MAYNVDDISLRTESDFTVQVVRISWVVLFAGIVFQLILFAEITNIIAMSAVVFAWLITTKIWLRKKMLEECLVRMPNQNLSEADARATLEFMRKNDGKN